ncbi:hypothetical protein KSF_062950 [Reticulibacter mediterranei]|uniref:DUF2029 domain-containing protein n=1 Tax=Reticulibacter mediterranei TaxID=2778369 RepID=A0A8J3N2T9_9CHLR|nr:hypothetical protein KSF_062950 [Reticulibacter mediterranei]
MRYFWLDIVLLLLVGAALYYGSFWKSLDVHSAAAQQTDVARYACYTVTFWQGYAGLSELPTQQCAFITHPTSTTPILSSISVLKKLTALGAPAWLTDFVATQSPTQPLHALPSEYPLIVMVPFSLAGLAPPIYYQLAFAVVMLVLMAMIYLVLLRFAGRWTACAFLLLLLVGGWGTALGRFDLFPAVLTLCALLCAERARWNYAFALLALAALSKIYPVLLVPAFLIAQQREYTGKWFSWRRWLAPGLFLALCIGVSAVSLLLSVAGTLAPLSYFGNRPIQVESVSSSLLWLAHTLGGYPLTFGFSFGSRNMFSPLSSLVATGGTVLLVVGLLYTLWLQWRGKITLALSSLLILLIIIYTGKVFSAQYLIWIAPIIAYVSRGERRWLLGWGSVSLVTTLIYPFLYERPNFPFGPYLPDFYLTVFVRNALFSIFLATLFYVVSRRPAAFGKSSSAAETGS